MRTGSAACLGVAVAMSVASGCTTMTPPGGHVGSDTAEAGPFWTVYSGRHIYAPTLAWEDTSGLVTEYHLRVNDLGLVTPEPWADLSSIWEDLDEGRLQIALRGVSASGATVFQDTIATIKSPGFSLDRIASYRNPRENGIQGLEAVLRLDKVQHWLDPGGPDPGYALWVHPSKLMGVLSQGLLFLSQTTDNPEVREQARSVALELGTFLLGLREPAGAPLEGWTHTYWDGVERGAHPIYLDQIMVNYPSEAAQAFLNLFDATSDSTWFVAALDIAETYARTQRDDGTWYLLMRREDGSAVGTKLLVPVSILTFLDRLYDQYGVETYHAVREAAFAWTMTNPVQTYAWEAQFEDTRPKRQYRNLSQREAAMFARLLFETSSAAEDIELAEELLRFVEDQFVVWNHSDAVTRTNWFRDGMKWNGNRTDGRVGKDWLLPSVVEQYAFYTPIAWATSNVLRTYCAGYEATGNEVYRDKARALSMALVEAQAFHRSGEIPTHLREVLPEQNWLNNSVYSAQTLVEASCL